ncbi:MAG: type II toxin-antitoxin system antitoxin SocA domain-containing protein [Bacteroidota bacterium]
MMPTSEELGKRITHYRNVKSLSQESLAAELNVTRTAITQIESGKRSVSAIELMELSKILGFNINEIMASAFKPEKVDEEEELLPSEEIRIEIPKLKTQKFKQILLYILERCAGKPNVGETLLYKLLYFCDFNYYELHEEHLTGAVYRKLPFGPVPQKLDVIINQMIEKGELKKFKAPFHNYNQTRYMPLVKPNLTHLNGAEKEMIDRVIEQYSDWSGAAISEYSHKDMPWKATKEGDIINYELAFYRELPFSVRTYDESEA